jgi:hypothetical protein
VLEEGDAGAIQVEGHRAHRSELRGQARCAVSVEWEVALQRVAVLDQACGWDGLLGGDLGTPCVRTVVDERAPTARRGKVSVDAQREYGVRA